MFSSKSFAAVAALAISLATTANSKAVFAHYMMEDITEAHAHQDIDTAMSMGIDHFVFNIGDPTASFIPNALQNLFEYAEYRGFKLFVSLDVYASGDARYNGRNSCSGIPLDASSSDPELFKLVPAQNYATCQKGGVFVQKNAWSSQYLTDTSICLDIANQGGVLNDTVWPRMSTTSQLQNYENQNAGTPSFTFSFVNAIGYGQSFTCGIPMTCSRLSCSNLNHDGANPSSGWTYAVAASISNFNLYLGELYRALTVSYSQFSGLQVALQQTFYPTVPTNTKLQETLGDLSAAIVIISGLAGTAAGPAAGLMSGVFSGLAMAMTNQDTSLQNLATIENQATTWTNTALKGLIDLNGNFTLYGKSFDGLKYSSLFDKGAWVDFRNIAVLNQGGDIAKFLIDATSLNLIFFNHLVASVANFAWKQQRTFMMSYPMSQSDFLDGKDNLKYYDPATGRGYYLQSYIPIYSINTTIYGFSINNFFQSSIKACVAGGVTYKQSDAFAGVTATPASTLTLNNFNLFGIFTIPVCQVQFSTMDKNTFAGWLQIGQNNNLRPAFCACVGQLSAKDKNGDDISKVLDLNHNGWIDSLCSGRQYTYAPSNY